jgi:predicted RNase H-like nuclease (RuvC/YqgF family)
MAFPKRRRAENNAIVEAASVRRQDGNEDDYLRTNDDCQKQEQQEWHDLDLDYRRLTVEQEKLQNWLEDLKTEEVALQEALDQVESAARTDATGQSRRQKPSHEQAIDRLAQALFQDDEDDDDDSDDSNDSNEGVKAP